MSEMENDDEGAEVVVCAGPPDCHLKGLEAEEAAKAGCPICTRIVPNADGSETRYFVKSN